MACIRCESERLLNFSSKCSDCFSCFYGTVGGYDGYVPEGLNIGSGDYIDATVCMECGQLQGKFPVEESVIIRYSTKEPNE